jgi:hypothetical protein
MTDRAVSRTRRASAPVQRQSVKPPEKQPEPVSSSTAGPLQKAGPAVGLDKPIQRQVAMGTPGDRFEQEADTVADKVTNGQSVDTGAISPVGANDLGAAPEQEPMQRKETSGVDEKRTDMPAVQKQPAASEQQQEQNVVQRATAAAEQKPPEQMMAGAVQKQAMTPQQQEQKVAQKATAAPEQKPPEPMMTGTVQKDAAAGASGGGESAAASSAIASKGAGKPLDSGTRGSLESSLGADLGSVRVHDDASARASAQSLNARAFTHGNDIWLGPGASQNDTRLMAHEATHVVQQSGGLHRMVQKAPKPAAGKGGKPPGGGAIVDHGASTIEIPELRVPKYKRKADAIKKKAGKGGLTLPKKPERPTDQRQVWAKGVEAASGYKDAVLGAIDRKRGVRDKTGKLIHVLNPKSSGIYIIGDDNTLPERVTLPRWTDHGSFSNYDVDHIVEAQLGGSNTTDNMELLDPGANRSSGSQIHSEIVDKIVEAIQPEVGKGRHWPRQPSVDKVQSEYAITFQKIVPALDVAGNSENFWAFSDVSSGVHMKQVNSLKGEEIKSKHVIGEDTNLVIYARASGGIPHHVPWSSDNKTGKGFKADGIFKNFIADAVTYSPGSGGTISGIKRYGKDLLERKRITWQLDDLEGFEYTTYVNRDSVLKSVKLSSLPKASPIEFSEVELGDNGGINARGVLNPTLPLLKGLSLDVTLEDDQLWFSKTFTGGDLSIPGPVQVTGSNLTLSAGTPGLKVDGRIDFEIERLGKGQIKGKGAFGGDTDKGLSIVGDFQLDKSVFDGEAKISAGYENDDFWAKGHLSIGAGKIRGIKSASFDASYAKGELTATGAVKPDIPAVEEADLSVEYKKETGLRFIGDLALKQDTPGIGGGKIHIEAAQPPGAEGFKVKGSGSAKPKIPGIESELKATYDDGIFDASVTAAYNQKRLGGSIMVGVTNREVPDGQPTGPAPAKGDHITVYGGGSVTVSIGPLQGTVGVHLRPDGEIEVAGEVDLNTGNFPPLKSLDRNIFKLHLDIPILGITVPVVDVHIGIFATIEGGLDVDAAIGPGVLTGRLGIKYNPSREEETKLWGCASLHVPAHAGLRVFVSGGLGAGIPLVDATAKLTAAAKLGVEGALDAGVPVEWTPGKGLTLDPFVSVYAEPKLTVSVTLNVDVVFDTWVHTFHLYHYDKPLADFEYGSNLRFGVNFPMHYDERSGFDMSLDKVSFQVPQIKPTEILSDIISRVV